MQGATSPGGESLVTRGGCCPAKTPGTAYPGTKNLPRREKTHMQRKKRVTGNPAPGGDRGLFPFPPGGKGAVQAAPVVPG